MDFSVLGPLEVRVLSETVPIRRGLPRALLTYLLLHPGEPVTPAVLADRAWNGCPPSDYANAVHRVVSYLRRTVGTHEELPLQTTSGGYLLEVSPAAVDSTRFAALVRGCGADPAQSLAAVDEALGLWRGEPLADVADMPWASPHVAELEELHLQAQELRLTCLMALGRHVDAVPQARALAATHPLRESVRTSLMLALYRSGRQSEALAVVAALRRTLAEELGLDPSPVVLDLERRILNQDPELAAAPTSTRAPVRVVLPHAPHTDPQGNGEGQRPTGETGAGVPRAVTSLVGRNDEVSAVRTAFDAAGLMTLTGPGGTGKTRMALAVLDARPDRPVWFADLSGAGDDATVASIVAAATGTSTSPGVDVVDAVVRHLAGSSGVLVLDTCEHVVDGAAMVARAVLHGCPQVRQLATSRRPLGVTGEVVWPVPPLRLPPASGEVSVAEVRAAASVELFAQRAVAVRPDFRIDGTNAADVAAICRTLDGLPLAIELAAAHVDVLSPAGIRRRLDDRFSLLVSDSRDVVGRQRTLRAAISSSVALLAPDERALFSSLAVFVGAFDLDAVVAVAGDPAGPTGTDHFRSLASLLRQSLVTRVGDDRYRLLDSVRAYAAELLEASPSAVGVRRRHAEYHAALAEAADLHVRTEEQQRWLALMQDVQPDLRMALRWCLDGNAPELGARLAGALAWFWTLEGLLAEAQFWLDRAQSAEVGDPRIRSRVLLGVGLVAAPLGRLEHARDACAQAADLSRSVGDDRGTGDALITLGVALWALGDLDGAATAHDEAVRRLTAEKSTWRRDVAVVLRARTAVDRRDDDAGDRVAAALAAARGTGDAHLVGLALTQQARAALRAGRADDAVAAAEEALEANRRIGYREGEAAALTLLARASAHHRESPADRASEQALAAASDAAEQALGIAAGIDHRGALCHAVEALAAVRAAAGNDHEALLLLEIAEAERRIRGIPGSPAESELTSRLTRTLRARLGEDLAASVAQEACGTTVDGVVEKYRTRAAGAVLPPSEA